MFNINPYIAMIICLLVCFINIILTFLIYEIPVNNNESDNVKTKINKKSFSKKIILLILLYGIFYAMIGWGQKNSKLFIQFDLQNLFKLNKVAIYMSIFIFLSRISRLLSNLLFLKIYLSIYYAETKYPDRYKYSYNVNIPIPLVFPNNLL